MDKALKLQKKVEEQDERISELEEALKTKENDDKLNKLELIKESTLLLDQ